MNSQEFQQALAKYADVIVHIGLNLQKRQRLAISAGLQDAELVQQITTSAYKLGVPYVDVKWADEKLTRIRLELAELASLSEVPKWMVDWEHEYGERGDARLAIFSSDPSLLDGIDPERIATHRKALAEKFEPTYKYIDNNTQNWCVVATAAPAWANKVFPDLPLEKARAKLWEAIFKSCRVDQDDPVEAWHAHSQNLQKRSAYLNARQYASLHYTAPGTNLELGLPSNHQWIGGSSTTVNDIEFIPNLPTEEVFSMPHRDKAEGHVSSSKPLILSGSLIEDFTLTFENGRVTKIIAKTGEELLRKHLDTDESASHLGEVALVANSSPISQSNLLFYNTLFDENAASHIAVGSAYRYSMINGSAMSKEEFIANGGNDSLIHTDFMIGSDKMNIDGIKADGSHEPIMRAGEWAFEI